MVRILSALVAAPQEGKERRLSIAARPALSRGITDDDRSRMMAVRAGHEAGHSAAKRKVEPWKAGEASMIEIQFIEFVGSGCCVPILLGITGVLEW